MKISKKALIAIVCIFIIASVVYIIIPTSNKKTKKINYKLYGIKARVFKKAPLLIDTIITDNSIISFNLINNKIVVQFEEDFEDNEEEESEEDDNHKTIAGVSKFHIYENKNWTQKQLNYPNAIIEKTFTSNDETKLLVRTEDDNGFKQDMGYLLSINHNFEAKKISHPFPLGWSVALLNDNLYYENQNLSDSNTYYYTYNFTKNKIIDSIQLNNVYNNQSKDLSFLIQGRAVTIDSNIYLFPSYFSKILRISKKENYQFLNTIDSVPMPKIKYEVAGNFSQTKIDPEIYCNLNQQVIKNSIYNLSGISYENNKFNFFKTTMDIYDKNSLNYEYSLKINYTNEKIPFVFFINEKTNQMYMFCNDDKTILVYQLYD